MGAFGLRKKTPPPTSLAIPILAQKIVLRESISREKKGQLSFAFAIALPTQGTKAARSEQAALRRMASIFSHSWRQQRAHPK